MQQKVQKSSGFKFRSEVFLLGVCMSSWCMLGLSLGLSGDLLSLDCLFSLNTLKISVQKHYFKIMTQESFKMLL